MGESGGKREGGESEREREREISTLISIISPAITRHPYITDQALPTFSGKCWSSSHMDPLVQLLDLINECCTCVATVNSSLDYVNLGRPSVHT